MKKPFTIKPRKDQTFKPRKNQIFKPRADQIFKEETGYELVETDEGERYRCTTCGHELGTETGILGHIEDKHGEE